MREISQSTEGYSGADIRQLCSEASMQSIREIPPEQLIQMQRSTVITFDTWFDTSFQHIECFSLQIRPISIADFRHNLSKVKPSVSPEDLHQFTLFDKQFGSTS